MIFSLSEAGYLHAAQDRYACLKLEFATSSSEYSLFGAATSIAVIAETATMAHLWVPLHHSSIPLLRRTRGSLATTATSIIATAKPRGEG